MEKQIYNACLGNADKMALSIGARFYADTMYKSQYGGYSLFSRAYFRSNNFDSMGHLQELAHYSQTMNVYTELHRPCSKSFINTNKQDLVYTGELQELH